MPGLQIEVFGAALGMVDRPFACSGPGATQRARYFGLR